MQNSIKEIRIQKGITQKKLAELCDCTKTQIYNIETGKSKPSIEICLKISHALNENIHKLFRL